MKDLFYRYLIEGVDSIYDRIVRSLSAIERDDGAMMNTSGSATFLYHYAYIFNKEEAKDLADSLIELALGNYHKYSTHSWRTLSFCAGLAGTGWIAIYLRNSDFIDINEDDLSYLDDLLFDFFKQSLDMGNYDFLHGASGVLVFYLARKQSDERDKRIIFMLQSLLKIAYCKEGDLFWESYDLEKGRAEDRILNLGLAHGTPSILAIFSQAYKKSEKFHFVKQSVEKCAYTILKYKNKINKSSCYSYSINTLECIESYSRLGWCYGDLGVAVSLWQAGNALGDVYLIEESLSIFRSAALRRGAAENYVRDVGLCHGASGVSHIFYKYGIKLNDKSLSEASRYWMDLAFEMAQPTERLITGQTKFHNDDGHMLSFGLLEGLSGVGLSMLSQISGQDLKWDECLLL